MKILIVSDYYFPGYKAGGPIQSIYNLISSIEQEVDIYVITRDRDSGDIQTYEGVVVDSWNKVNDHKVYYLSPSGFTAKLVNSLVSQVKPDAIHVNSFFSPWSAKTLIALTKQRSDIPVFMSVRGEFGSAALASKAYKKKVYVLFFNTILKRFCKIAFIATNDQEGDAIRATIGENELIYDNANSGKAKQEDFVETSSHEGEVRFVTVARISPIKNLKFFAEVLKNIDPSINILWTIYGRVGKDSNVKELLKVVDNCTNIKVDVKGAIPNHEILASIKSYDFFVLPTLGENFGHAIYDAFLAGVPTLISDKTPWRDLQSKGVGWDIPLELSEWTRTVTQLLQYSIEDRNRKKLQTYNYGSELIRQDKTGGRYLSIIESNISQS